MKNTITFTVLLGLLGLALLLWGCSEEYDNVSSKTPQLIFDEINAHHPVWSPLGDTIVFSSFELWTIDPEGGNLTLFLSTNEFDPPAYALYPYDYSDDCYLMFTDDSSLLPGNIYYIPPQGNEPVYLFPGSTPTVKGNIDGTYNIAYLIHEYDVLSNGIYLSDIHGSEPQLVLEGDFIYGIDWSPDGTKLAYIRGIPLGQNDWEYELCVYDFTTQSEQVIYDTGYAPNCPRWSPDGTLIAFADHYIPSGYEWLVQKAVWTIPSEGGEPKRITEFPYDPNMEMPGVGSLSWSPDGKWIVYDLLGCELWKVSVE